MAICEPLRLGVIARHAFGGIPPGQNFWKKASYSIPLTYRCFLSTTMRFRVRRRSQQAVAGGGMEQNP